VLLDEKYDQAFGIKVKEAGEVFIVIVFFIFIFFLFYSVTGRKNMMTFRIKVREGWKRCFSLFFLINYLFFSFL
jgi:hypothetical protein